MDAMQKQIGKVAQVHSSAAANFVVAFSRLTHHESRITVRITVRINPASFLPCKSLPF
jgi:hypothetical protein